MKIEGQKEGTRMNITKLAAALAGGLALGAIAVGVATPASADSGWVAVAKSPSKESLDWGGGAGRTRYDAVAEALQQCARLQNASDCSVLETCFGTDDM